MEVVKDEVEDRRVFGRWWLFAPGLKLNAADLIVDVRGPGNGNESLPSSRPSVQSQFAQLAEHNSRWRLQAC